MHLYYFSKIITNLLHQIRLIFRGKLSRNARNFHLTTGIILEQNFKKSYNIEFGSQRRDRVGDLTRRVAWKKG
jgi:hypothetical protein